MIKNQKLIEDLDDAEFIFLSTEFSNYEFRYQLYLITHHFRSTLSGLFGPIKREIEGEVFSFGFEINYSLDANRIANAAIESISSSNIGPKIAELDEKIRSCNYDEANIKCLLQAEIDHIRSGRDLDETCKKLYFKGYRAEITRTRDYFDHPRHLACQFPDEYFNLATILFSVEGSVDAKLQIYCTRLLESMNKNGVIPPDFSLLLNRNILKRVGGRGGLDNFAPFTSHLLEIRSVIADPLPPISKNSVIVETDKTASQNNQTEDSNKGKQKGRPKNSKDLKSIPVYIGQTYWNKLIASLIKSGVICWYPDDENTNPDWIIDVDIASYLMYYLRNKIYINSPEKRLRHPGKEESVEIFKNTFKIDAKNSTLEKKFCWGEIKRLENQSNIEPNDPKDEVKQFIEMKKKTLNLIESAYEKPTLKKSF